MDAAQAVIIGPMPAAVTSIVTLGWVLRSDERPRFGGCRCFAREVTPASSWGEVNRRLRLRDFTHFDLPY